SNMSSAIRWQRALRVHPERRERRPRRPPAESLNLTDMPLLGLEDERIIHADNAAFGRRELPVLQHASEAGMEISIEKRARLLIGFDAFHLSAGSNRPAHDHLASTSFGFLASCCS